MCIVYAISLLSGYTNMNVTKRMNRKSANKKSTTYDKTSITIRKLATYTTKIKATYTVYWESFTKENVHRFRESRHICDHFLGII